MSPCSRLSHRKYADQMKRKRYTTQTLPTSSDLEVSKGFYIHRFDGNTSAAIAPFLSLALWPGTSLPGYISGSFSSR